MTIKINWITRTILCSLPALLSAPTPTWAKTDPPTAGVAKPAAGNVLADPDIQRAVQAVYPALVRIHVVMEEGDEGRLQKRRATGSGTIITKDGYILTNHHVAGRATRLTCRLADREEVDAELVGTDPLSDLAVLKLDLSSRRDPKAPLPYAKFGNSDKLKVGDVVLAMGSPAGLSQSVTKGIVANTEMISPGGSGGMQLDGENVGELVRWIGHDAVIYPGNSGGPLVNLQGEIIGVNEVGIGSLGGAIPSNLAQAVAKEIIATGHLSRSWTGLGVQPLLKKMAGDNGVLVAEVMPKSPAAQAGIEPGDFITNYNGIPVVASRSPEDIPVFNRLVLTTPVGATVTLQGSRKGEPRTWRLQTVEREPKEAREVEIKSWGLTVRDFTRVSALEAQRKDRDGVLVDTVRPGGPASEAKPALSKGDVILKVEGRDVANVKALQSLTRELTQNEKDRRPLLVTFEHNDRQFLTVARVGPDAKDEKPARPAKAWLGADTQVLTSQLAEALQLDGRKGVRVTRILPGSPAATSGLQVGDILLKLDGQVIPASTPSDDELFDNLIRAYRVGDTIELVGQRGTQPLKLSLKLDRQPKPASELPEYKDDRFEFTVREMSLRDRVDDRLEDNTPGLKVSAVQGAGWTALAGLSSGDVLLAVDGQPMDSVASLESLLQKYRETKPRRIVFYVRRGIHTAYLEIEPKW
jgi:serine protease Do